MDLQELSDRRSGWESSRLVTATYLLSSATYSGPEAITAFQRYTLCADLIDGPTVE